MLAQRITVAMIGLVLGTAVAIALWTHHQLVSIAVPGELGRMRAHAYQLTLELDSYAERASEDVRVLASSPALRAIVTLDGQGENSVHDGATLAVWRQRLAELFQGQMAAKPWIMQFRLIGVADDGREIVRVERADPGKDMNGALHVVADHALQPKGNRAYFQQGLQQKAGAVYISPMELNQEHGKVEVPYKPVLRAVTPVFVEPQGLPFGVLVINVDMRPVLARMTSGLQPGSQVFVVDGNGEYLSHASDHTREFAATREPPHRWQDDYPELAARVTGGNDAPALITRSPAGTAVGAVMERSSLEPDVGVIETAPYRELLALVDAADRSSLFVAVFGVIGALVLAVVLSRSLSRPLEQMTAAVESFAAGKDDFSVKPMTGELIVLASAFRHMANEVNHKTAELEREISDRRIIEKTLQQKLERERTYLAVVESCEESVVTVDLDGRITGWNQAAEKLYGYTAAEAMGCSIDLVVPPGERAEMAALRDRLNSGERIARFETVRIGKSGQPMEVSLGVSPIMSEDGTIVGIAKLAHDISARKEAEERFRLVVESAPSGMCVVAAGGGIMLVNKAIEGLFGYTRDELIGRSVDILVPDTLRPDHATHRDEFAASPEARPMGAGRDLFARHKDGRELAVEIGLCPINLSGQPSVLCSVVDVTERRRSHAQLAAYAAQLEDSNAELQQFAYVVSHDIKAPLRGIASVAEWLVEDLGDKVDDDTRENLSLMLERTGRLSKLIEGILAYSRAGRPGATRTAVDTGRLVGDVVATIAPPPHVEVKLIGPFPVVTYDETQLRQVFQNLIDNAVKHLDKPSGVIEVSCQADEGDWIFSVKDNGVGIPEAHFRRIFGLFQTLRPKDECQSTGAGLAIVERIIEKNGGTIWVTSREGEGAEFLFRVPGTSKDDDAAGSQENQA